MRETCALVSLVLFVCMAGCAGQKSVFKIAFGSCGHQDHPLPVFNQVVRHRPDLFIFLGDNIYGDTHDMNVLRSKYARLGAKPSFQNLRRNVKILAVWDDHDYGWDDAGRHYPQKAESKEIFLDFFGEPASSERRKHKGIYGSHTYAVRGKRVQIILLDIRTFRDDLRSYQGEMKNDRRYFYGLSYSPHVADGPTMLGDEQWKWLEGELQKESELRIIASGTQFGIEYNGYEAWANFPHEQRRLLNLIKKHRASGVLFITGDVHYAEISKLQNPDAYPVYDVTASGLSSTWEFATPNKNRIEGPVMDNHFGLLTIDVGAGSPTIKMEIWDVRGNQRIEHTISLDEISFPAVRKASDGINESRAR